jgi:hypothetical protein
MKSRISVVSRSNASSDSVDVSVALSPDWGVVPTTGTGGETLVAQVGISPARTETERKQVNATVNMNRFMELAPYLT